jgi:hypothetical protein
MKQLLSLCFAFFTSQILFGQIQTSGQTAFRIKGKVSYSKMALDSQYVYLYANYKGIAIDSALLQLDSTFNFTLLHTDTLFAYKINCMSYEAKGVLPKNPNAEIYIHFKKSENDYQIESGDGKLWDDLFDLAHLPLELVERKNFSIMDSAVFLQQLKQVKDSALRELQNYQNNMQAKAYLEYKRWILMNSEIAKLDFFLLKRFHQKEKTFDAVSPSCTILSHQLLADSTQLYFTAAAYQKLKIRVAAMERINFQTARFNPFEGDCQGIEAKDLKYHEIFSDGPGCMYGIKAKIDIYQNDNKYLMGWAIPPRFEQILPYNNELAIIKQGGKFGLINGCGQIVAEPVYKKLHRGDWKVNDSLPLYYYFIKEKYVGVMDHHGKEVLEDKFEKIIPIDKNHFTFVLPNDHKVGIIDPLGKVIVEPKYDEIKTFKSVVGYYQVSYFHPHLSFNSSNGKNYPLPSNGLIDAEGKEVIQPGWYEFEASSSGVIHWDSYKYNFLRSSKLYIGGGYFIPENGTKMPPQKGIFYNAINKGSYFTVKEKSGQYLFFPNRDSLTKVKFNSIDLNGKERGIVSIEDKKYLIDEFGEYEKFGAFDEIIPSWGYSNSKINEVKKNGKWGLFSFEKFDFVTNCEWDAIDNNVDIYYLKKNGKWTTLPFALKANNKLFFDTIYRFYDDYFMAKKDGLQLVLDNEGNIVFECVDCKMYYLKVDLKSTLVIEKDNRLFKAIGSKLETFQLPEVQVLKLFVNNLKTLALVDKNGFIKFKYGADYYSYCHRVSTHGIWVFYKSNEAVIVDSNGIKKTPSWCKHILPYYLLDDVFYPSLVSSESDLERIAEPHVYKVYTKNGALGLLNHEFRLVVDTFYSEISFEGNLIGLKNAKGLFIKDASLKDILYIPKAKRLVERYNDRIVIEFAKGKKGLFYLNGNIILKPEFEAIRVLPNGLIMASNNKEKHPILDFSLYDSKGKKCSNVLYNLEQNYDTDLLGMSKLIAKDYKMHIINKQGKLLLSTYKNESSFVRVPKFTSNFSLQDTIKYKLKKDTLNGIQVSKFFIKETYRGLVVIDSNLTESERDVINQVNAIFWEKFYDINEFNSSLNKYIMQVYDAYSIPKKSQNLAFYFDKDSIYKISSEDLIIDSMQMKFALNFITQISIDKNIEWNACTKTEMLFTYIKLETDFSEQGLTFTSKSFNDLEGFSTEKSVSYTWQELSPYLNKNHVLAKRFFGSTQDKN